MRILWFGPLLSDNSAKNRVAVSMAAVKWTRGFIGGLNEAGADVRGVTHCYERLWPKGQLLPGVEQDFDNSVTAIKVKYPNVPFLKDKCLSLAYKNSVANLLKEQKFDLAFCYNTLHPYHVSAMKAASDAGVLTVPIVLDVLKDPRKDDWQALLKQTSYADGIVFLSKWAADNYPGRSPTYHMEGGCSSWIGNDHVKAQSPKIILHAGGLDFRRGGNFFPEVLANIKRSDIRFVFCGKFDMSKVSERLRTDPRVSFPGFLSPQELNDMYENASVFLNAKDPEDGENILNFPSKVSNYLPYGKPIVSTWLGSFSDDYKQVLALPDDNTPEKYAEKICEIVDWNSEQCKKHSCIVKEWFFRKKLWSTQVSGLLNWVQCLVSEKNGW